VILKCIDYLNFIVGLVLQCCDPDPGDSCGSREHVLHRFTRSV